MKKYIETSRLILREWCDEDIPKFAQLNSNERAMEYLLKVLSHQDSHSLYDRIQDELATCGFGVYAVEEKSSGSFIGCVGFHNVTFEAEFTPAVEILWRLLPEFWNKGYATEAAMGCLGYAQVELNLKEVTSFTSVYNKSSERVMQKLGMKLIKEFNHPLVDPANRLCRHLLYKIKF